MSLLCEIRRCHLTAKGIPVRMQCSGPGSAEREKASEAHSPLTLWKVPYCSIFRSMLFSFQERNTRVGTGGTFVIGLTSLTPS